MTGAARLAEYYCSQALQLLEVINAALLHAAVTCSFFTWQSKVRWPDKPEAPDYIEQIVAQRHG
jgi:hypothetical protein